MRRTTVPFAFAFALACAAALPLSHAADTQWLRARIGAGMFESGDAEITLVPIGSAFSLTAATRGASAWPPPKTRIDRLAVTCDGFEDGKTLALDAASFRRSTCSVTFEQGTPPMGGEPEAKWTLDEDGPNRFAITAVRGKAYEGEFAFRLVDGRGGSLEITDGRFVAEDRQL